MSIVPNNKLSNHFRKKKTEKHIWFEDQTVSSSFQQNLETMKEKTKIGMFYEDYLKPNVSFSNNICPDFYNAYSSMPNNDFNGSMINPYANGNDGVIGIEGMDNVCGNNNVFGGDNWGLGNNNNNFVEDGVFCELTDCQNVGWTVMSTYIDNEMQTKEYTFKTNPTQNQSSVLDSDTDSLPDGYESFYGLSPSIGTGPDGTGDLDGEYTYQSAHSTTQGHIILSIPDDFVNVYNDNPVESFSRLRFYAGSYHSQTTYRFRNIHLYTSSDPTNCDSDYDGLYDGDEVYVHGTEPTLADTDGDVIPDGVEIAWGLNPLDPADANDDADNDGLTVGEEFSIFGSGASSPDNDWDYDGDGLPDGWEVYYGLNPNNTDSDDDGIPDNDDDLDGDSLNNSQEYQYHLPDGWLSTEPIEGGEGLVHGVWWNGLNPISSDTDGDGMPDDYEYGYIGVLDGTVNDASADYDNDDLSNYEEYVWDTYPGDWDSDNDGLPDGYETFYGFNPKMSDSTGNPDSDGLGNLEEYQYNIPSIPASNDGILNSGVYWGGLNPLNPDCDNDGMLDGYEVLYGLNPKYNDAALDKDNDGLTNLEEFSLGTKANSWDSDGDSLPDYYEIYFGLNPLHNGNSKFSWNSDYTYKTTSDPDSKEGGAGDFDSDGLSNLDEFKYNIEGNLGVSSFDYYKNNFASYGVYWNGTNPILVDSDADGISDGDEDKNKNGKLDSGETNPLNLDSDFDGLSDGIEINGWQIFIVRTDGTKTTKTVTSDPLYDDNLDADGVGDYSEFVNCTDPTNPDTDGDGISDLDECNNRSVNPQQYNPNIQDSLPPTVKNVKISMSEHWTSITVTIIPSVCIPYVGCTPAVTASVSIIDGISVKVTADIWDASGVESVMFTKDSTVVDGLLVSGNTFNAGFFLGISLGSLIKLVTDVAVGFTVKVKAFDYLGNWNECNGTYKGPFTVMVEIYVSMLMSAWNAWCEVAEKIKDVVESLASWMWDVITSMIDAVLNPIVNVMKDFVLGVVNIFEKYYEKGMDATTIIPAFVETLGYILTSPIFYALITLVTLFFAIEVLITALTFGAGTALGTTLIQIAKPLFISAVISAAIAAAFQTYYTVTGNEGEDTILSSIFGGMAFGAAISAIFTQAPTIYMKIKASDFKPLSSFIGELMGLTLAVIGVVLVASEALVGVSISLLTVKFSVCILGAGIALWGAYQCYKSAGDKFSTTFTVAEFLAYICAASSLGVIATSDWSGE